MNILDLFKVNRITKVISLITAASLCLSGCGLADTLSDNPLLNRLGLTKAEDDETYADESVQQYTSENSILVYDTSGSEITSSESVIDMMEDDDEDDDFVSAADLVAAGNDLKGDGSSDYAYSKLSAEEQKTYDEILAILSEVASDVVLTTKDSTVVDHSFRCVLADHPEIFYVTGYSISKYMMNDEIQKITFKGAYTMDKAGVDSRKPEIDSYVNQCLSGISADASEYEKVKYVYEYLIDHNTYDLDSENNQNILSVIENGVTVCQGYAKMTQLLLNKLGMFCTLVNGSAQNSSIAQTDADGTIYDNSTVSREEAEESGDTWGSHVWNIVMVDGEYYNVDTTWGDASFLYTDAGSEGYVQGPDINYDFLLVPDSMIKSTHMADPVVDMPVCTSMKNCYYVKEGLYFGTIDENQLKQAFDKAYANGDMFVSLKCSDSDVFNEMRKYLFEKEKIFNYMTGNSVKYVEYPDRYVLSIYL